MFDLLKKVRKTISDYKMLSAGENRVLIAVSGGPDSIVLADLLIRLSEEVRLFLCLAHLDHMFRGEESAEDARFVQDWAAERGLSCIVETRNVSQLAGPKESKQEAARRVRYEFLQQAAEEFGASKIALAHTATDQAETVIMRVITGGGTLGLAGIPPIREGRYIRPLIRATRSEIEEYISWRGLSYRVDPSNNHPVYLRNKIRLQLVPYIKSEFNPKVEDALARSAEILRAEENYLQEVTLKWLEQNSRLQKGCQVISSSELMVEPKAIQRRVIRELYYRITGDQLSFEHVESVLEVMVKDGSLELDLPGAVLHKSYNKLFITRQSTSLKEQSIEETWELPIPGVLRLPRLGIFTTKVLPPGVDEWQKLRERSKSQGTERSVFFDLAELELPLVVRTRRAGDEFQPFGLKGTKKLKDFLIDEKVPLAVRNNIPLVLDQKGIIWVSGMRQSQRGRITTKTSQMLEIKLEKLPAEYPYDIIF